MILWLTLAQLGAGMLGTTALTPQREVGDNYLRFTAVTAAVLLAPLSAAGSGGEAWFLGAACILSGIAGILLSWGLGRAGVLLLPPATALATVGLVLGVLRFRRPLPEGELQSWLLPLDTLSSAALLGATFGAMLLGHWYLVNTDMPGAPLQRLSAFLAIAAVAKLLLLTVNLGVYGWPPSRVDFWLSLLLPPGLFYVARALVGVGGPLLLAPFIWKTARMNATQSATGILYAAVVLVLIGEMIGNFLMIHTRFPF